MVTKGGELYALYFATCYEHEAQAAEEDQPALEAENESWIDVVFGTWGQGQDGDEGEREGEGEKQSGPDYDDHVTFGCRYGPVGGGDLLAGTVVEGASVAPDSPLFGEKLAREAALQHPRLAEFWAVVDFILATDPLVHRHHYGHELLVDGSQLA